MGYDQTYACCERESNETRRSAFEVYKVFAFASPHICVLCVVGDTSLPQTSCSGCVCVREGWCLLVSALVHVCLSSNTHICILYMAGEKKKRKIFVPSELLSPCFADKQKQGGAVLWGLGERWWRLCCLFM